MKRATFRGESYIFFDDHGGFLATEYEYRSGAESFAFVTPDGDVMRHGQTIGNMNDVVLGEEYEPPTHHFPPSRN